MRILICALLLVFSGLSPALGQWLWLDASGKKVYSDQGPPSDVPESRILRSPNAGASPPVVAGTEPPAAPASAAAVKPSGKDAQLEARKKQAEQEAAAQRKAEAERERALQNENCERLRASTGLIDSGVRVRHMNANGEPEILDDAGRAKEKQRLQGLIDSQCK